MRKIGKHVAIIVSGGRTGTRFLGEELAGMVEDAFSVHEPDLLEGFTRDTWERLRVFGFYHMVVGRVLGRTGLRSLSQRYLGREMPLGRLVEAILAHRQRYYDGIAADYVIESHYQWFGLLDAVPEVFERYKVLGIVRDPRSWVRSWLSFGGHFDSRDWVTRLGFRRLDPAMIGDEAYASRWPAMSAFEKNCWQWQVIYSLICDFTSRDEQARLYRFEDLFESEARMETFRDFLEFLTNFPDRRFAYRLDEERLSVRKNVSNPRGFPRWQDWQPPLPKQLDDICGPLMRDLGYGDEPEWRELVGRW